jgi:hypothetical protein
LRHATAVVDAVQPLEGDSEHRSRCVSVDKQRLSRISRRQNERDAIDRFEILELAHARASDGDAPSRAW